MTLSFAACGHGNSSPAPTPSVTPVPTASASAGASASPCAISLGIAYEPDGGNGGALHGIQYTHFEANDQALCSSSLTAAPPVVNFSSSVGAFALASDASDGIALLQGSSGGYTLAQDIFGTAVGSLTPVGNTYDFSVEPTPAPAVSGASPSPTPTAPNAPLLSDAQSISILGGSSLAVALALGAPLASSTPGIVALTSLTNAPPQYGNAIPFTGSSYTLQNIPQVPRNIVRVGVDSSGAVAAVARGPQDLLTFSITSVATGYQFNALAENASLGTGATLRGSGLIAFDPADVSRVLLGGTTGGGATTLTLVTGLPNAITIASQITVPGTSIRSIAITSAGVYAVVATDVGIVSVGGVNSGSLALVTPFAPSPLSASANAPAYTTCTGATANLTNVNSVGISADQKYLVALGSGSGVSCPSGYNASIIAVPYNPATGTAPSPSPSPAASASASPNPSIFVQNNIVAPPTGADYLVVH